MNTTLNIINRQCGRGFLRNYDVALTKLAAHQTDCWRGVEPAQDLPNFNPDPPLLAAKFANTPSHKHILAIANEDGKVGIQDVTRMRGDGVHEVSLAGEQCHHNAVFDVEWMPGHMKLISVSGDHTAKMWELRESKMVETQVFTGHSRSVKTAAFRKTDPAVFVTGGRDGIIKIWDTRALGTETSIFGGHAGGPNTPQSYKRKTLNTPRLPPGGSSSSITGLVFQDENTLISSGAGDGVIKVWDIRRNYTLYKKEPTPKYKLPYAGTSTFNGFTNLLIDDAGLRLYASCMDNNIYCYNVNTYSGVVQKYSGAKIGTFYIKSCLSPDGRYLFSGSSDEKAYIWNIGNPTPLCTLDGHSVEVTCVAWTHGASDGPQLVTCSEDARHKVWRLPREEITVDVQQRYRGRARMCPEYMKTSLNAQNVKLECTPRSVKRFCLQNEKTPGVESSAVKRTQEPDESKNRPHTENGKSGRRLFSPVASTSRGSGGIGPLEKGLHIIFEETMSALSPAASPLQSPKSSPLGTRDHNTIQATVIFSPTSNLPNFVLDGEAPHIRIQSPRKTKENNVDWLTKIRKQKQVTEPHNKLGENADQQRATAAAASTKSATPKRRLSGSSLNPTGSPQAKIPRRSVATEPTLFKFFHVTPTTSKS